MRGISMFFRRTGWSADRAASDRLLDPARADAQDTPYRGGPEPLARLLSAAAAPARPGELAGEEEALAAFRAARAAGPAVEPAPSPRRRRFTGAVAWGAGIVVTATAGAAFAAVTLDRADDPAPPPRPATPAPATTDPDRGGSTGATGGGHPTGTPSHPSAATSGAPAPGTAPGTPEQRTTQLRGLCRAYLAKKPAQRQKALDTPAFAHLVTAAGGREQVDGFCGKLVPEAAAKESPNKPPKKGATSPPAPAD
ncbi:hypothetical protein OG777_28065 [Micromonospora peucetia]|uniref:hypothetical protein n=1 Tax=Micromonospora peucetia TaxID=47871 RepID=UPI002251886B|nr:hypothetical protein [Micromonospora peucetia]MCX4390756.1 hypothetical protein [Micromonospora peucetia]